MRFLISTLMILAFTGLTVAEDKIDPAKLVGKWEDKDPGKGEMFIIEFTKDNKVQLTRTVGKNELSLDGTYKVEGNKLKMVIEFAGKSDEKVLTIDKLTDDEFPNTDDKKKSKTFRKLKDK